MNPIADRKPVQRSQNGGYMFIFPGASQQTSLQLMEGGLVQSTAQYPGYASIHLGAGGGGGRREIKRLDEVTSSSHPSPSSNMSRLPRNGQSVLHQGGPRSTSMLLCFTPPSAPATSTLWQLQSSANLILLSLAVSDFLMCCVVIPVQGSLLYVCWRVGDILCVLYNVFICMLFSVSVGGMILISMDRYVAICDPMHYPTLMCRRSVSIALIACWIIFVPYGVWYHHHSLINPGRYKRCEGECYLVITHIEYYIDLAVSLCVPFVLIIILYCRVFFVAVSQARAMRSPVAATAQQPAVNSRRSELKLRGGLSGRENEVLIYEKARY